MPPIIVDRANRMSDNAVNNEKLQAYFVGDKLWASHNIIKSTIFSIFLD